MLPIVDYGSVALVISKISVVGKIIEEQGRSGFEVFLEGQRDAFIIFCENKEDAAEMRKQLIAVIADYYYSIEFGEELDAEEFDDFEDFSNEKDGQEH